MHIKILGPGCANCTNLEKQARKALGILGIDATIEKVTDYAQIAAHGIMATPGLIADGEILVSGRVAQAKEIAQLLSEKKS